MVHRLTLFQSTHPHGVRHAADSLLCTLLVVSIHAPTRGATCLSVFPSRFTCFNPRTHTGCDVLFCTKIRANVGFNPRTHTGCDKLEKVLLRMSEVSIHAPTRGATFINACILRIRFGFNPRTHTGCDLKNKIIMRQSISFNPRTHTGCDCSIHHVLCRASRFNPRTHTGCDTSSGLAKSCHIGFNPRTHTGCDAVAWATRRAPSKFQSTHPHGVRHYLFH